MIYILLALQDDLIEQWLAAQEADRPAIEKKLGKGDLPKIEKAAKDKPEAKKLRTRVLLRTVVTPWAEKEYGKAKEKWNQAQVQPFEGEFLAKMLPDHTVFTLAIGHIYPVATAAAVRAMIFVKNDGSKIEPLVSIGAKRGDGAKFLNEYLSGAKGDVAAAALILFPPCTCQFGREWIEPADLTAGKITNKKLNVEGKVEFDGKGNITKIEAVCNNMHPICVHHRAAARDFLLRERPAASIGELIATSWLPDHYLYEVIEDGHVVGFVRVRRLVMECRYVDRGRLEGLPWELRSLLTASSGDRRRD